MKMRVGGFNLNQLGDEEERVFCVVESERNMRRLQKGMKEYQSEKRVMAAVMCGFRRK